MTSKELVKQMTLEEKASLCSGLDFWRMKGVERLGLPSVMVTDGPHGLRKQQGASDALAINNSAPATCFPTASAAACSFDPTLLREIGEALGEECLQEDVAVILGPGANIKRSPLCGRNFEYFSEDPLLSGTLAAAWIQGVQSKGVGTSLKHFACNNQETRRMVSNSLVDERALREIYLASFEHAVKQGQPQTVMCSYNQINGEHLSENKRMLTDILRGEWGFSGIVMTDWGAVCGRVKGLLAGLDLEMPGSQGYHDGKIVAAVKSKELPESVLDETAERIVELILRAAENRKEGYRYDAKAHHNLACRAAAESTVLLKNEGDILPLRAQQSVAVVGAFAKTPRYQGAGSSKIHPTQMDCAWDALEQRGIAAEYAPGYPMTLEERANAEQLREEACRAAQGKDLVLVFAGLPDSYESEGFDRIGLDLPKEHNALIAALAEINANIVVVLQCGAPVVMPWADSVRGIVLSYLGGQGGGTAAAQVLLGEVNPGGKLAESFPLSLEHTPCESYYPGQGKLAQYRESIFVGYRYYESANQPVAFPFGYGLSYTSFHYADMKLSADCFTPGDSLDLCFTVTNSGSCAGAEVAQLYVSLPQSSIPRAKRELRGFAKLYLEPGESREVTLTLDTRSFAYYNEPAACWAVEGGSYELQIGSSSRDILLTAQVQVTGDGLEGRLAFLRECAPNYFELPCDPFFVPDKQYEALLGHAIPDEEQQGKYTMSNTLSDIKDTFIGKKIQEVVQERAQSMIKGNEDAKDMVSAMLMDMPIRALATLSQGSVSYDQLEAMLEMVNGNPIKGMMSFMKKMKKDK